MTNFVVDTNVPITASGKNDSATHECIMASIDFINDTIDNKCIVIDDNYHILKEYQGYLTDKTGQTVGQVFFKWVFVNQSNPKFCICQPITKNGNSFNEFPNEDPDLERFDPSDRKFVAVALACDENVEIAVSSDRGWRRYSDQLAIHGLNVRFLCE